MRMQVSEWCSAVSENMATSTGTADARAFSHVGETSLRESNLTPTRPNLLRINVSSMWTIGRGSLLSGAVYKALDICRIFSNLPLAVPWTSRGRLVDVFRTEFIILKTPSLSCVTYPLGVKWTSMVSSEVGGLNKTYEKA